MNVSRAILLTALRRRPLQKVLGFSKSNSVPSEMCEVTDSVFQMRQKRKHFTTSVCPSQTMRHYFGPSGFLN